MMNDLFVKEIALLAETKVVSIDSKQFSTRQVFEAPDPRQYAFPTIDVGTLDSVVDYIKDDKDKIDNPFQIVAHHNLVSVISEPKDKQRLRDVFLKAYCEWPNYHSGTWMGLEDFRIHLLTMFEGDTVGDRELVLRFISGIIDEAIQTSKDDGISQSVTAKKGLTSYEKVTVPSPVTLAPYRTFTEVPQPTSSFLFRMRKGPNGPEAALFEVVGPWKRSAALRVAEYLRDKISDASVTILA